MGKVQDEFEDMQSEINNLWDVYKEGDSACCKEEIQRLDNQLMKVWRALRHSYISYGPDLKIDDSKFRARMPVVAAVELILDHLDLKIEKRPAAYVLSRKDKE